MSNDILVKVPLGTEEYVCGTLHVKDFTSQEELPNEEYSFVPSPEVQGEKLILMLHGLNSNRDTIFYPTLSTRLPYSNFRFDFRGNGKSSGIAAPFSDYNQREKKDVLGVIKAFESQGWKIYGIIGHSKAGTLVAQLLGSCPNICAFAINISGRLCVADGMHKRFAHRLKELNEKGYFVLKFKADNEMKTSTLTKKDIEAFLKCDEEIFNLLNHSTCAPLLTIHGSADEMVVLDEQINIYNRIKNHKLCVIEGGSHMFEESYEKPIKTILEYIETQDRANQS